jgi:3-oxoacid CoA-transferase subunit A
MAARITIAEVEELVEPGEIDPDQVHLPGIFVQRVVPLTPEQAADKKIENVTVTPRNGRD